MDVDVFRFWLVYCPHPSNVVPIATQLYDEAIVVPFMANFVVFAKRRSNTEAQLRMFCMTDDKMDKTLESQESFIEIARSRDVEVGATLLPCIQIVAVMFIYVLWWGISYQLCN